MTPKPHQPKPSPQALETHLPVLPKPLAHSRPVKGVLNKVLAESTLTSKGQVTIPQAIRSMYQLDAGDSLVWRLEEDGRLVVEPKRSSTLADIRAAIAAAGVPVPPRAFTNAEMDEAIGQALESKFGRH
jgi:AbrB family looped-hinge helix DNA binding protein